MPGESQIVADLYRRYGAAVHRRARTLVGDGQEALDITQETFLAFMDARTRLRGEASAFTVLFQIATHKAVDSLRRRARWSGVLSGISYDESEEPAPAPAADEGSGAHRVEAALDLALLSRGEAPEVLNAAYMYFVERYTTEEIGQALGLSRKTIGKYLAGFTERARARAERLGGERKP
jgi:RNA polymerase sigma-70 factor (ECF subfamily)